MISVKNVVDDGDEKAAHWWYIGNFKSGTRIKYYMHAIKEQVLGSF